MEEPNFKRPIPKALFGALPLRKAIKLNSGAWVVAVVTAVVVLTANAAAAAAALRHDWGFMQC